MKIYETIGKYKENKLAVKVLASREPLFDIFVYLFIVAYILKSLHAL